MKIVDVHAHLDHVRFEKDLDEVVERFVKVGGGFLVTSGVNSETNRKALEFAKRYDVVRASFGIYPIDALACEMKSGAPKGVPPAQMASTDADKVGNVDEELDWIEENKDSCFAIGEIGLDYSFKEFQNEEMRQKQKEVFRKCLVLAKKIDKVVVIHSRKAEEDAIDILEDEKMEKVIMHCFSGRKSLIRRCVENGWNFSVPVVIIRLEHFKMLVEMVPLSQLLTETDAPYLSPVVGERNESVNIVVTLGEIARIKGVGVEKVSQGVWDNFEKLFR